MDSNITRFILVALVIAVAFFLKKVEKGISLYIVTYLLFSLIGEGITLFYDGYNLVLYSVLPTIQVGIIASLVYSETKRLKLIAGLFLGLVSILIIFISSDISSHMLLKNHLPESSTHLIHLHQFFDYSAIICAGQITLAFIWLINIVQRTNLKPNQVHKRYLYILALIVFYGGTFFMLAFGRLLLPSFEAWYSLWSMIFYPILFMFYSILFTGLLWK